MHIRAGNGDSNANAVSNASGARYSRVGPDGHSDHSSNSYSDSATYVHSNGHPSTDTYAHSHAGPCSNCYAHAYAYCNACPADNRVASFATYLRESG